LFKRILASLIILPITLFLVWGYLSLRNSAKKNKDIFSILPSNPVILVEFHHVSTLQKKLVSAKKSSLFHQLLLVKEFKESFDLLSKALQNSKDESSIHHALKSNDLYLSFYSLRGNNVGGFFSVQLANDIDRKVLFNFLETTLNAKASKGDNNDLFSIKLRNGKTFYAYFLNSILSVSNNELLLKDSWLKLMEEQPPNTSLPFANLQDFSNEFSDLSVYYQSKNLQSISNPELLRFLPFSDEISPDSWLSADFDFNDKYALANGFIQSSKTNIPACGSFQMGSIIPATISTLDWRFKDLKLLPISDTSISHLKLKDSFTNEIAFVKLMRFGTLKQDKKYLVYKLEPEFKINSFLHKYDSTFQFHNYTDSILSIKSEILNIDTFLQSKYLAVKQIGNYVVCAENTDNLKLYVEQIKLNNVLANNLKYAKCFDINFRQCSRIKINHFAQQEYSISKGLANSNATNFSFYSVSNNGKQIMQNYLLNVADTNFDVPLYSWKSQVTEKVKSISYLTFKKDSLKSIAVVSNNKIDLYNLIGNVIKTITFSDTILNNSFKVRSPKSGNLYLVVATSNKIFAIDARGSIVKGFPVRLSSNIKNTKLIYGKNDEPRILVQTSKQLMMLDMKGSAVDGWNNAYLSAEPITEIFKASVNDKVIYTYLGSDTYIHSIDSKGKKDKVLDSLTSDLRSFNTSQIDKSNLLFFNPQTSYKYDLSTKKLNKVLDDKRVLSISKYDASSDLVLAQKGLYKSNADLTNLKLIYAIDCKSAVLEKFELLNNDFIIIRENSNSTSKLISIKDRKLVWTAKSSIMPELIPDLDNFGNLGIVTIEQGKIYLQYLK
jgi:hypothetical protein